MKKFQLAKVTSPSIEFECMGTIIPSQTIKNTNKTPNFAEPVLERKIMVSLHLCHAERKLVINLKST